MVVSNPDAKGRTEILNLYLQDKPLGDDVDVQVLARGTPGFSGAGKLSSISFTKNFTDAIYAVLNATHNYVHVLLLGNKSKLDATCPKTSFIIASLKLASLCKFLHVVSSVFIEVFST